MLTNRKKANELYVGRYTLISNLQSKSRIQIFVLLHKFPLSLYLELKVDDNVINEKNKILTHLSKIQI